MKNTCEHCPCCGRHCRRDSLRCKRGCAYFDKLEGKESPRKWEKNLTPDGLTHRFVRTGCDMKKGLRRGRVSEEAFLAALSDGELTTLDEILAHLQPVLEKKHVSKHRKRGI